MDWSTLPREVRLVILEYAGMVKNRNGKFMGQIAQDDPRYAVLQSKPPVRVVLGGDGIVGCGIMVMSADFKRTIDDIQYDFTITRSMAIDYGKKCYMMREVIAKWRNTRRVSFGEYVYR